MEGKIIVYHYIDAEFGDRFIVDDTVFTSDEKLQSRMNEIREEIKHNIFATLRTITTKTVTIN